jgi:hypothetical protein
MFILGGIVSKYANYSAVWFACIFIIASAAIACGLFAIGVHVQWLLCDAAINPMHRPDMVSVRFATKTYSFTTKYDCSLSTAIVRIVPYSPTWIRNGLILSKIQT